ncbi:TPA: hypothetical protein HA239_03085 [Candidatus Woesearchaeota archaeon]|nr:hypothetical protein QT06_C0001G0691 [archaeon GW2011_AR15]MBS3103522.1 hypothetical protein [Candidatus Woesearchaeota archaeon]HIH41374.1 hypothetical protein [Candidatus Woesearchaeota archaeon]
MSKTIEYVVKGEGSTVKKAEAELKRDLSAAIKKFGKEFGELEHVSLYVAEAKINGEPHKAHLVEGTFEGPNYTTLESKMETAFNSEGYKIGKISVAQTYMVPEEMYNAAVKPKSPTAYAAPQKPSITDTIIDILK